MKICSKTFKSLNCEAILLFSTLHQIPTHWRSSAMRFYMSLTHLSSAKRFSYYFQLWMKDYELACTDLTITSASSLTVLSRKEVVLIAFSAVIVESFTLAFFFIKVPAFNRNRSLTNHHRLDTRVS